MRRRIIPYRHDLVERARQLRQRSTRTERMLWQQLKGKQVCGYDFHRQRPIGNYIVDFYAPDLQLAIEIDGSSHDNRFDQDQVRQEALERYGVRFLRFTTDEILKNMEGVIAYIREWIQAHEGEILLGDR